MPCSQFRSQFNYYFFITTKKAYEINFCRVHNAVRNNITGSICGRGLIGTKLPSAYYRLDVSLVVDVWATYTYQYSREKSSESKETVSQDHGVVQNWGDLVIAKDCKM